MKKRFVSSLKKENLGFVVAILIMILTLGCGKDDKNVTSVVPPDYYLYGTGKTSADAKYLNIIVQDLSVSTTAAGNLTTWSAPSGADSTLTAYKLEVISLTGEGTSIIPATDTNKDIIPYLAGTDTSNVASGTYTYKVSCVFTIYDTLYSFYTQIESLPSRPFIISR